MIYAQVAKELEAEFEVELDSDYSLDGCGCRECYHKEVYNLREHIEDLAVAKYGPLTI